MKRWVQIGLSLLLVVMLSAFGCGSGRTAAPVDNTPDPPPAAAVPTFDADRAFSDLVRQVGFGPRNPGSEGHAACRAWMVEQLRALTDDVAEQPFTFDRANGGQWSELANILAAFPAAAGRQTGGPLLIGAHWDTRPVADMDPNPANRQTPILGANDGASGVAVCLELARLFAATPPPRPIIIALFDLEDAGLLPETAGEPLSGFSIGARHFAANMGRWRPSEAIIVDLVGDCNLHLPQEANSRYSNQALLDRVWAAGAALGFSAFDTTPRSAIIDDHLPLIHAGVPSIDIIDLDYPGPNSNRYWHTLNDNLDNVCASSLRQVGQTVAHVVYTN